MSSSIKTIRSQPPDAVVSVGSGNTQQDFECYKVVLSFASEYLDTMLSTEMMERNSNRIEFPDKDPKEWEMLYKFIDPDQIWDAKLNVENAMTLLPWFHEFQMGKYVKECDKILSEQYVELLSMRDNPGEIAGLSFWRLDTTCCEDRRKALFGKIMDVLEFACTYDLEFTEKETCKLIGHLMLSITGTHDLFDVATFQRLVPLLLPFENCEENAIKPCGKSSTLWESIEWIVRPHISSLSAEVANNEIFPLLLQSYYQQRVQEKEFEQEKLEMKKAVDKSIIIWLARENEIKKSAKTIIEHWVQEAPGQMYNSLPQKKCAAGCNCFKGMLYAQYRYKHLKEFQKVGVTVPDSYSQCGFGGGNRLNDSVLQFVKHACQFNNGVHIGQIIAGLSYTGYNAVQIQSAIAELLANGRVYKQTPGLEMYCYAY